MSNINRIDLLQTNLENQKNNDTFSAKLTSDINSLKSSSNSLFTKVNRINKRVTELESKSTYQNNKAIDIGYSDAGVIYVHNDERKVNVITGVSTGDVIELKSTEHDAILYICNYEANSVTIEGQSITLTKNKINKINCIYILGNWLIDVETTYASSLLEDCVVRYASKSLPMYSGEDVDGSISTGLTEIPDITGNGNVYNSTYYEDDPQYYYGLLVDYSTTIAYSAQAIMFFTSSSEAKTKYRTLNNADFSNGVTISINMSDSYSSSTARKHFCLGSHSNTTSYDNTISMSSATDGTFTVKLQGTGDTDVVTGTFTGTKKNIVSLTITYDPSTSTARILKDGVELASGTLTNFTTGTDLLMANHFYTSESSNFYPLDFMIYKKVLTDDEIKLVNKNY